MSDQLWWAFTQNYAHEVSRYSIRPTKSNYNSGVRLARGGVAGQIPEHCSGCFLYCTDEPKVKGEATNDTVALMRYDACEVASG
jgi:hypothetical protein